MLPELMVKSWSGAGEYFTYMDMNRVEYNANICAREAGVSQKTFTEVTRASQFDYSEAQTLENLLLATAQKLGLSITIETAWGVSRMISYVDFERWESNLWTIYTALGGTGERVPAGQVRVTYHATLFASSWLGSGPYYVDLDAPAVSADSEALAYVPHTATVAQRTAEYNALLRVAPNGTRKVRVTALGIKPRENIPICISMEGLPLFKEISLTTAGWTGSGPWTQTVTLPSAPANAVIGAWEGMSDAAVEAMMEGIISVSAISGTSVTVRAIGTKPSITINPAIMYETSEAE